MLLSKQPLPYSDFFKNLQTGDIILMHGLYISSLVIEGIENCHWSHAAIAILAGDIGVTDLPSDTVLLWESNLAEVVEDVILKKVKDGPMLVKLEDRIVYNFFKKDDGDFAARKLNYKKPDNFNTVLRQIIDNVHDGHFPVIPTGEMGNFFIGRTENKPVTDNTFFCSQLAAHTFKKLGLLTQYYVDNSYAPVDFSEKLDIPLLQDAWLGKEIWLDKKTIPKYNK
jgi:hypothetical protein